VLCAVVALIGAAVTHPRDRVMRAITVADVRFSRRKVVVAAASLGAFV
jgi:hypothetical protein